MGINETKTRRMRTVGDVRNRLHTAEALIMESRPAVENLATGCRDQIIPCPEIITPLQKARQFVDLYRRRNDLFRLLGADDVFADPAWHMLMDLFIAAQGNRKISVSSLCIASRGPPTTALRYITIMVEKGLLIRTPDPDDSRRIYISLASAAYDAMEKIMR